MEVVFHRFVLAEFNTHRTFSRNSASSRAIPALKQTSMVQVDPARPVSFPAEQKGMQGGEELSDAELREAEQIWRCASRDAVEQAAKLISLGVHKSVTNRLLEPFLMHKAIVTSTAWENFFEQRCSPLAKPEIRSVAELMHLVYDESVPEQSAIGAWHLPYVDLDVDRLALDRLVGHVADHYYAVDLAKISAARCARVSYLTQDGRHDVAADLALYERLVDTRPAHWSPLEHVATPWTENRQPEDKHFFFMPIGYHDMERVGENSHHLPRVGNLLGWRSLRTEVEAIQNERTYR